MKYIVDNPFPYYNESIGVLFYSFASTIRALLPGSCAVYSLLYYTHSTMMLCTRILHSTGGVDIIEPFNTSLE